MKKKDVRLFGGALRFAVTEVLERLGKQDRELIKKLVELAIHEQTPLNHAIDILYADKDRAKALGAFASLRKRFNDAASGKVHDLLNLDIRLTTDRLTRNEPQDRFFWFIGVSSRAELAAEMSRRSVSDVAGLNFISNQALTTTTGAINKHKHSVRFFVSYSHVPAEAKWARELIERLKHEFAASPSYELSVWMDGEIPVDQRWHTSIQQAIDVCDFGLLLVSVPFLGSKYIQEHELPHFVNLDGSAGKKPVIPIGLSKVDFKNHDLKGLQERQVFRAIHGKANAPRFYAEETTTNDKNDFVQQLFVNIQQTLDNRFRQSPDRCAQADCDRAGYHDTEEATLVRVGQETRASTRSIDKETRLAKHLFGQPEVSKHFEPTKGQIHGQSVDSITYLKQWLQTKDSQPILYLLGDYGIGKTTTLKQLTLELLQSREEGQDVPLPIFIDLRQMLSDKPNFVPINIQAFLTEVISRNWKLPGTPNVTADDLLGLVREEKALLIFDGLDEKTVHMTTNEAQAFLRVMWQALPDEGREARSVKKHKSDMEKPRSAGSKVGRLIISCRTHYFRDTGSAIAMLTGDDRETVDRNKTPVMNLLPFDDDQIQNYITALFDGDESKAGDAIELIRSVHNLQELASRPYLLSMIVERLEEFEVAKERGEIVNSARLYQLFIERWLNRDTGKHTIDPMHKRLLMEQLAAELWRTGNKEISPDDLDMWLDRFIAQNPVLASVYSNIPRPILKEDLRTACFVLRQDEMQANDKYSGEARSSFRFAHTSLQEFFLATYLWHGLCEGQPSAFDLPMVSLETLDFLGQIVALEPSYQQVKVIATMNQVLEGNNIRAAMLAFRYWLRAIEGNMPMPEPGRVNLAGANLDEWNVRGKGPDDRLDLRGANLHSTQLNRTRLQWVDLSGADCRQCELRQAILIDVVADDCNWTDADASGAKWRRGSCQRSVGAEAFEAAGVIHVEGLALNQLVRSQCGKPQVLVGHGGGVCCCEWSPDGRVIASASMDMTVKLWETRSGKHLCTLNGHKYIVQSCTWSPDGHSIASASSDSTIKLWDVYSGKLLLTFNGNQNEFTCCAWNPNGQSIASASSDGTVAVWNTSTGKQVRRIESHSELVTSCAWSPDGRILASASYDRTVKLWNMRSGELIYCLKGHKDSVYSCKWSPDGQRIASASGNVVKLWDSQSGQLVRSLKGHDSVVYSCAWSPDGQVLASASDDGTVKMWNTRTGKLICTLEPHEDSIFSCSWSPDSQFIASASNDCTVQVRDARSGKLVCTVDGNDNWVRSCDWSPDSERMICASDDGITQIWDIPLGRLTLSFKSHNKWVLCSACSPNGQVIASASDDTTVKLWDSHSGNLVRTLKGHKRNVQYCDWKPDGQVIASASDDKTIKLWNSISGKLTHTLKGHKGGVLSCVWSPDGQFIISGSRDCAIFLWNANSGKLVRSCVGHVSQVRSCAWSPDGEVIASGSDDGTVKLWEPLSGSLIRSLEGHCDGVLSCEWSSDGRLIASASDDGTVRLWVARTGKLKHTLKGHKDGVHCCAWSPDGKAIASASRDRTVKIWDPVHGLCMTTYYYLPEGQWVCIDEANRTVKYASAEAWRWLVWEVEASKSGWPEYASIEAFGPIPGLD